MRTMMRKEWRALARYGMAAVAIAFAVEAQAATELSVLIDADQNSATGCTATIGGTPFTGIEARLDATADTSTGTVSAQTFSTCSGGAFGAPTAMSSGHAIGNLADPPRISLFELGVPPSIYTFPPVVNLTYAMTDSIVGTLDSLGPFSVGVGEPVAPAPAPSTGLAILAALVLALGTIGARRVRRHPGALMAMVAVTTLSLSGLVWALAITLDGDGADWTLAPLGTDAGQSARGVDIRAVYATSDPSLIAFRVDAAAFDCGVFFGGGYQICLAANYITRDAGVDDSFEQAWRMAPGTVSGDDGACPVGTSFHTEMAVQQFVEPSFYQFMIDRGFSHYDDFCLIN